MFQTQNGNASCIVSKVLTRHYNHWLGPTHGLKGTPRAFLRLWPRKMPVNEFVEQTEQKFEKKDRTWTVELKPALGQIFNLPGYGFCSILGRSG